MKKTIQPIVIFVLCLLVIFLLFKIEKIKNISVGTLTREKGGNYKFTNPILDFEISQEFSNFVIPISSIKKYIDDIKESSGISHISVYFRDLNNGQWIGIEEKEYFSPASMLKTPLLIALLKWSEKDPSVLEEKVVVEDRFFENVVSQHNLVKSVERGSVYSLFDLSKKMIQESDNVATRILYEKIPKKIIDDVYLNIGVPVVKDNEDLLIRVKDMGAFFRVLFNASYLNRENSELALSILSNTSYRSGIVAGVKDNILVSHKFGERFSSDTLLGKGILLDEDIQLHDCGIVYYPNKPYILCIMTRGNDFKKQESAISEISKFVYNQVSN